ncbi:carbohydrate ABC transporter permease [Mycoplasmopsis agassizii]|uniref:carbohydrate ABC transporter permease n=1 Tax=Mycoplasmopsis agassizii TaxID=33922 RepID=UPI003527A2C1
MFTTRLALERKLQKFRVKRTAERNSKQITDRSIASIVTSFIFKMSILVFFGILLVFPFVLLIAVALHADYTNVDSQGLTVAQVFDNAFNWNSFEQAFSSGYWFAAFYSAVSVVASIVFKLIVTTLLAYAFSFPRWRGKRQTWLFLLSLLILPESALLTGQLLVINSLELNGSTIGLVTALVLPYVASTFHAFMLKNSFEMIPDSLKLVAKIDGFSGVKFFFKIALPMVSPTTWTIIILTTLASWNSFLWPSIILSGQAADLKNSLKYVEVISLWTIQSGQVDRGDGVLDTLLNVRLAAALLAIAPIFILYFVFRKKIMNAISRQGRAIKG